MIIFISIILLLNVFQCIQILDNQNSFFLAFSGDNSREFIVVYRLIVVALIGFFL